MPGDAGGWRECREDQAPAGCCGGAPWSPSEVLMVPVESAPSIDVARIECSWSPGRWVPRESRMGSRGLPGAAGVPPGVWSCCRGALK
jgi:hypothetical protein